MVLRAVKQVGVEAPRKDKLMGKVHVKKQEYKVLKNMIASGNSMATIHALSGRGQSTLALIRDSQSFLSYQKARRAYSAKYRGGATPSSSDEASEAHDTSAVEFDKVKIFLGADVSIGQIAKILGRSRATVSRMANTETYEDYKALLARYKATATKEITPVPNSSINELIVANTNALNDLARAWNNLSEKLDEVIETKRPWLSKIKN